MNSRRALLCAIAAVFCFSGEFMAQAASSDPLDRTTPEWFDSAKLGIFIHWTAGSIPAFAGVAGSASDSPVTAAEALRAARNRRQAGQPRDPSKSPYTETYARSMLYPGSATARYHAEYYGDMPYARFVEQFRDEVIPGWTPEAWADLFARAGARYVVFTTRLDDGFLFWPSAHPNPHRDAWQSTRDVVGELTAALRARGLRVGFYYSGGVDYTFSGMPMDSAAPLAPDSDGWRSFTGGKPGDPINQQQRVYVNTHWRELIERYKPDILWNDYFYPGKTVPGFADLFSRGPVDPAFKKEVEDLFRFYLRRVPEGIINNRFSIGWQSTGQIYTDFVTLEYNSEPNDPRLGRPEGSRLKWESNRSLGTSYGYNRMEDDTTYMSPSELIHMFVDIVARGGNLLINVGPMSSGEIAWPQAKRLLELGWFLRTNGQAIYGTKPWEQIEGVTGDGLEVRYTTSQNAMFATILGTVKSRVIELDLELDPGVKVILEGTSRELQWRTTPIGVRIELPFWPEPRPAMSLRFSPASGVHPSKSS